MIPSIIIIAPHADDEIIGCYELLSKGLVDTVLFPNERAIQEAIAMSDYFEVSLGLLEHCDLDVSDKTLFFPDPTYEIHPAHRNLGAMGEELLRRGQAVCFYTTNMSAPYIHEVTAAKDKCHCLNLLYPNKKELWEYEHKYFLFEGYVKWLMKWRD